ncbi:P-loop containing nucleoside triphosphate hydrolase protein [Terfezia claveryi]|nr:P-loop containing nucleoside triphosphate hydrolase protein [Terfezia claveryi]
MAASSEYGGTDINVIPSPYKPSSLLPIARHRQALLYLVEKYPITIVVGQTGSGKTTQIPQYLHQAGWTGDGKIIACTQPRRVAATTVAARVAEEMGCRLGQEVGYSIRFEDMTSPRTVIKYLTDGLLLREILIDPLLSRYSVIMVDEAHERSLSTDILLGILKKIRKRRKDLRIIISSATLQAEDFVHFFVDGDEYEGAKALGMADMQDEVARVISLEGRMFPVDILYLEDPTDDYVEKAVQTVFDIHLREGDGDILVFLSGREEIETCISAIHDRMSALHPRTPKVIPLPLYAGLSTDQQMAVFEPADPPTGRKVIVSTNIAEASVTIDGVVYVIDSGFVKIRAYNPHTGVETLTATAISKASATQRAGRAGRTRPGKCYRLYTEEAYQGLRETSVPEVQRSNLAPVILQLKALGIDNIVRFDFLTNPPAELASRGLELLYSLGALDDYARLTKPLGYRLAELPVNPALGKILLNSAKFGCVDQVLSIAAMITSQPVYVSHDESTLAHPQARRKFIAQEGDHLTLLNIFTAYTSPSHGARSAQWCHSHYLNARSLAKAVSVRAQLKRYLDKFSLPGPKGEEMDFLEKVSQEERIRRCIASGLFANAARMQPDGTFLGVGGEVTMWAHPSSVLFDRRVDWVVFEEVVETGRKVFIKDLTVVSKDWLVEYAPGFYQIKGGGHTL